MLLLLIIIPVLFALYLITVVIYIRKDREARKRTREDAIRQAAEFLSYLEKEKKEEKP